MERDSDLLPRDLPAPDHPLMENNAHVRTLGDLIATRENVSQGSPELAAVDPAELDDLDVSEALTFPHKKRRRDAALDDVTDFDADARTSSPPDDDEDAEYMTREDVADSMSRTDPDANTGVDDDESDEFLGDAGLDRAPDMTGTVTGVIRGLGTHLPQDIGPDGFQIEEPEAAGDPRLTGDDNEQMDADEAALDDDLASDGGHIPTTKPDIDSRDDALDATRQLK